MDFSGKLSNLIELKQVTYKEVGDAIGVSRQTVSLYAKGEALPDIGKLKRIADYFQVDIAYLVSDESTSIPVPYYELNAVKEWSLKQGGEKLWQAVHGLLGLTDKGLDKVNERIEELNELKRYSSQYEEYKANSWKDGE